MPEGILCIDKPQDWTSFDVVAKCRGITKCRKLGHGGTLDPMATGVLPLFFGRAVKAIDLMPTQEKRYVAGVRFGLATDTQDITGRVLRESAAPVTREALEAALETQRGEIQQLPPMYSAVKINGKKLYELARKGKEVERRPRPVTIHALEALDGPPPQGADFLLRIHCSKGTYVRTLCHDIGQALGCGGCMSSLRRIKAAGFTLADSVTLQAVQEAAGRGEGESLLLPVDSCFLQFPVLLLKTAGAEKKIRNGAALAARDIPDGEYRVYGADKTFLALGRAAGGKLSTVKSFFEV